MDLSSIDLYQNEEDFASLCKRLIKRDEIHTLICENCIVDPFLIHLCKDVQGWNESTYHVTEKEYFYQMSSFIVCILLSIVK